MKEIRWNLLKSERIKRARGASFEEILQAPLIAVKKHPKKEHQNIMLFERKGYVWVVPYVENDDEIFLKTLYPSRRYTKMYRRGELK
ncbi:MAG: toxin [Candidatus Omnitrophica bacterium]|nr:toxin [Candidatus Omnitrophota bacterium]